MIYPNFKWILVLTIFFSACKPTPEVEEVRPNVLVIVADDMGWEDVGYHGSRIQTPVIDQLVKEGVELNQHYVTPMCTPTRAALLSGYYPSRIGDHATKAYNGKVFPDGMKTMATCFKEVGYTTGISGKWHLGSTMQWRPTKYGFDKAYGLLNGGCTQFTHLYKAPDSVTWYRQDEFVQEEGHTSDLMVRELISWIEEKDDAPWFYYLPFTAVHVPVEVEQKWIDLYKNKTYYPEDSTADADFKRYAGFATHMDACIGRVVESLKSTGQLENTIIVFFSDNGAPTAPWKNNGKYPGDVPDSKILGSNLPLKGYKTEVYEGGIRVPAFIYWKGKLRPARVEAPVNVVDWMPTLLKQAGYATTEDQGWDGKDIWPILNGEEENTERLFYWKFPGQHAIRKGEWKLARFTRKGGHTYKLYNLKNDPNETQDLSESRTEVLQGLQQELIRQHELDSVKREKYFEYDPEIQYNNLGLNQN